VDLPSGRVRLAELASSMILAAPLSAIATILSVPAFEMFGGHHPQRPGELALLFAAGLLGTWGVLVPSKSWEGRAVASGSRRVTNLLVGLVLGVATAGMIGWAHLDLPAGSFDTPATREFVRVVDGSVRPDVIPLLNIAGYFALAFGVVNFHSMTARDRKARFRFFPVVLAGFLAGALGSFVPSPQPWGLIVMTSVAVLAQLCSPWNREAAAYARYAESTGRRRRAA
jgi:hypothetical protein